MNLLHEKNRCRGAHRAESGLFGGGGGGGNTSSSTTSTTTTNAADRRIVADGSSLVVTEGGSASIAQTDLGSIQKAADLGQAAILGATKTATEANAAANSVAVKSLDLAGSALVELKDAYANANAQAQSVASGNKTVLIVGAVAVGLVAFNSMGKGKK